MRWSPLDRRTCLRISGGSTKRPVSPFSVTSCALYLIFSPCTPPAPDKAVHDSKDKSPPPSRAPSRPVIPKRESAWKIIQIVELY